MPIHSYLVFTTTGGRRPVAEALEALPECSCEPSLNKDLLTLVTDTPDEEAEKRLQKTLESISGITCLALVSAHSEAAMEAHDADS